MKQFLKVLTATILTSFFLEISIPNIQLLILKPQLFPVFEIQKGWPLLPVAMIYLLIRSRDFSTIAWKASAFVVLTLYICLSWIGINADNTEYLIAHAEGRTIGGGAAMGHLFLIVYLAGPAQIISALIFHGTQIFTKPAPSKQL